MIVVADVKKAAYERACAKASNEASRAKIKHDMKAGMAERVKHTLAYCVSSTFSSTSPDLMTHASP